jgi:hypothetical protein
MKAWLVVLVACGSAPVVVQAPKPIEPTGPELVASTPGATAFAIDGSDVYWLAPGSGVFRSGVKLDDADAGAHGLVLEQLEDVDAYLAGKSAAKPPRVRPVWVSGADSRDDGSAGDALQGPNGRIAATGNVRLVAMPDVPSGAGWIVDEMSGGFPDGGTHTFLVDSEPLALAIGGDNMPIIGTSTTLYRGSAATLVEGGVSALAADGDDLFFANTTLFEKYGNGPVNKLGPAGGPVTAMALDADFIYWAIAEGERDPAIYRARRSKPEMELFTRVGSASQLIVHDAFVYWLDPVEGAIHRIKRVTLTR